MSEGGKRYKVLFEKTDNIKWLPDDVKKFFKWAVVVEGIPPHSYTSMLVGVFLTNTAAKAFKACLERLTDEQIKEII